MTGVLAGLRVADLSWGIAGPMAAMLMGDHGADVIKIEPPGGDPFRNLLGYKVWQRNKRSVVLDLRSEAGLAALHDILAGCDVLIESFQPGTLERLSLAPAALMERYPRLIVASITAYGRDTAHAGRPGYDALVAARIGLQWEQRGWPEGAINHMLGRPDPFADLDVPHDWVQGPAREGPLFTASHWPSLGASFLASTGISAALLARETTGRGQHVETSLMQGAMAGASGVWQRMENPDAEGFDTWILGSKSPKGHFQCADGRWVHNWVPNPRFIMQASEGAALNATPDLTVQNDPDRFGIGPEELLVMAHYQPILAERMRRFPCDEWVQAAAIAEVTMQEARPVEAALTDPAMLADGCVIELNDPELGPVRQVGQTYSLSACPDAPARPAPNVGAHTDEVLAELRGWARRDAAQPKSHGAAAAPLAGVRVLDLGLAIAGPFGTQQLSDLGAEVIKVNALWDTYWHRTHIAYMANRGKRSVALNLKHPEARKILLELVKTADVVQHNMRYDAAERLGVDYESLKKIKPDLIYCHTRGHEHGAREKLPGNDQTGACLAGVQHEDGGMARGGKPMWSFTSFGDTGNGYLSAVGILQALYHRARTGQGQYVDTSIVNACLLNTSGVIARPDGTAFERPRLDADQTGFNAGCRLYETGRGWLCIVAASEVHWAALLDVLDLAQLANAYPDAKSRRQTDAEIAAAIAGRLKSDTAAAWMAKLDQAGIPAEISDERFSRSVFDDADLRARQWTVAYDHPVVGKLEQIGLLYSLSATPGVVQGPPLMVGDCTEAILREIGYTQSDIEQLLGQGVVGVWPPRKGGAAVRSPWDPSSSQAATPNVESAQNG
jgi:crotonobetainyl-CoA:carnitine CoA-transferase CaiB-like acyl-CoA transferase